VQTSTEDPKEAASGTEAGGEVANKKRKWVNKKRGGRQQQDQPAAQQPQQQAQKQTLNTKKEPVIPNVVFLMQFIRRHYLERVVNYT
jgi:hypothetical protein